MSRPRLMIIALVTLGCTAVFAYSSRDRPVSRVVNDKPQDAPRSVVSPFADNWSPQNSGAAMQAIPGPASEAISAQARRPESVAQWITEATSADAQTRAAAINALADAPRSQALPVLKRVLTIGEAEVDRQLALSSLHALALEQGDSDGRIRGALREALYHGDHDAVGQGAQFVIEDIERNAQR